MPEVTLPGILAALAAYLLGAIPFSFLIGKYVHGVDIRTVGSGNVGATNLGRACGGKAFAAGLALDAAKGYAAVVAGGLISGVSLADNRLAMLGFGCVAVIGHMAPVFLAGHGGGKGVATGAGVFLAVEPQALAGALFVFGATVATSRYVSLGSVLGAASIPVLILIRTGDWTDPVFILAIVIAMAIVFKHRANLSRIRTGTESRIAFGQKTKLEEEEGPA